MRLKAVKDPDGLEMSHKSRIFAVLFHVSCQAIQRHQEGIFENCSKGCVNPARGSGAQRMADHFSDLRPCWSLSQCQTSLELYHILRQKLYLNVLNPQNKCTVCTVLFCRTSPLELPESSEECGRGGTLAWGYHQQGHGLLIGTVFGIDTVRSPQCSKLCDFTW